MWWKAMRQRRVLPDFRSLFSGCNYRKSGDRILSGRRPDQLRNKNDRLAGFRLTGKDLYFSSGHVKYFTVPSPDFSGFMFRHFSEYLVSTRRPLRRTIRRVHVMPWATSIKRIGRTLSGFIEERIESSDTDTDRH